MKTSEVILLCAVTLTAIAGVMLIIALMKMASADPHLGRLFLPPLWTGASAAGLWVMAKTLRLLERIADGIEKIHGDSNKEKSRP